MIVPSQLSYVSFLVINLLLIDQILSLSTPPDQQLLANRSEPSSQPSSSKPALTASPVPDLAELDSKNETQNNEIGDNALPDKYRAAKELKYYLKAFNEDDHSKSNKSIELASSGPSITSNSSIRNEDSATNSSSRPADGSFKSAVDNTTTRPNDGSTTPFNHLFKSMCALTSNQVEGCERYECNQNSCYCNEAFDLTINLKSNWPIKYLCLKKQNYNEECLVDEQCSGKHQVCLNKRNFRNYVNHDLDYSTTMDDRPDRLVQTVNNTVELNRQIFIQQMAVLYNQTRLSQYSGKCRCRQSYFYNYYLSYARNRHFSKQFNSFLIENNSSDVSELFAKQKNLFAGHCLKVRTLNETCELNSECQMNDPSSVCRRKKCLCKIGFQIEQRNQSGVNEVTTTSSSVLIGKLLSNSSAVSNTTRLICEPISNLNLDLSHYHSNNRLLEKQAVLKNNISAANFHQLSRSSSNPQIAKNLLLKNCSDEIIVCDGRHNCVKKNKRLHNQENIASLIWTVLCMVSIILVLCMLLIKNKQDDTLEPNHNYNNYFLRNTSISNLNQQTTSFLGNMFGRSHANSGNSTELASINERSLISCTPPPYESSNEVNDDPPSYAEAVRLMQQKPGDT